MEIMDVLPKVVVLRADTTHLPPMLLDKRYIDFVSSAYDVAFAELLQALGASPL
jgi:hypothetical protein